MEQKEASSNRLARVRFEPGGIEVHVPVGTLVSKAAISAGSPIETTCGSAGICGKCRIIADGAMSEPDASELHLLSKEDLNSGFRLACRARIAGDIVITIPSSSRSLLQKILSAGMLREVQLEPGVTKVHLALPQPSLEDERAEFERIADALTLRDINLRAELRLIRNLSEEIRKAKYDVTAVVSDDTLIALEPGDTTDANYGIAFDLGSTTIVGYLMDLSTGQELAIASAMNPQMTYGDDLISRIKFAATEHNGLELLRAAAVDTINRIIRQTAEIADIRPENIYEATIVGNTCMTHIFMGIDPGSLGQSPYVPTVCAGVTESAEQLGIEVCPGARIHILPSVAGFVGADLVGVLLAGVWEDDGRTRLAVDIGTNGEMALRHNGKTYACSAAAGPAFEGARISCGMRGSPGAIDSVEIDDDVRITTIESLPAAGLCGSGLIDAIAGLLDAGLLDDTGRLLDPDEVTGAPDKIRARLVEVEGERAFELAIARQSATRQPILLLQRDIRQLQLAKGSMRAAIETLLKIADARPTDISEILLAGAFGNYIRKESAMRIGLVPAIALDKINPVGNAAGAGARLALLSRREHQRAGRIARDIIHVELANHPAYQNEFMDQMMFPAELNVV
jgi:uncharacterized 2Fe-2S/4Fe-4S cluster protein (DUF4445 family)